MKAGEIVKACAERAAQFHVVSEYAAKCRQKQITVGGLSVSMSQGLYPQPSYWSTRWLEGRSPATEGVLRRLAWLEGDYQTGYRSDKRRAAEELKKLEREPEPDSVDGYLQYLALLDAAEHAYAEKKIRSFLVNKPSERRAAFLMGAHLLRKKKFDTAKFIFSQLEKNEDFLWKSLVMNNLGQFALMEKNRELAIEYFEKASKASPRIAAPLVNLGALYLQSASFKAAEPLFAKALETDPDFEDAALGLGVAVEGQGNSAEAHAVYARFMEAHGDALSTLYNDSLVLGNAVGDREKAAELMLLYIQRGGKQTARAREIIQSWR
jgi:tetratricopeptide (TPR) repeat protein